MTGRILTRDKETRQTSSGKPHFTKDFASVDPDAVKPMTDYVTHSEFKQAMADIDARFVRVEARLEQTATRADVEGVKAEVHKMDASIKTWMLATVLTIIGTMLAAIFGVAQVFKGSAPVAQPSPIIIQAPAAPPAK